MSLLVRSLIEATLLVLSCGLMAWMLSEDDPSPPPQVKRRYD